VTAVPEALVVGSGPNGLAAAIVLARAGVSVHLVEAAETIGGGMRSEELTLPGFVHDSCSALHPLALASPFFRRLPLEDFGLEWVQPHAPLAHPLDHGRAVLLHRSLALTADALAADGSRYARLVGSFVASSEDLLDDLLAPPHFPHHPALYARFAALAALPASRLARVSFATAPARALFAGLAAHAALPLTRRPSAAFAILLGTLAHSGGWPLVRGGSHKLADSLASYLRSLGGTIETGRRVNSLSELAGARAVLLDLGPRELVRLAGDALPSGYRASLERFGYGPGVFKLDWALDAPIPWRAAQCAEAATVHVGGALEEIAASERSAWARAPAGRPFLLVAQQSLFDPSRAPRGRQTAWAYCHVPNGFAGDMTAAIELQLERFAPGFRERILARSARGPAALERTNANYVGGDIGGGALTLGQLVGRPVLARSPYATPLPAVFLCSSSTAPGPGTHGMCGYHAALAALDTLGRGSPDSHARARTRGPGGR
jgi:phytoene dehydrogenase-like protein